MANQTQVSRFTIGERVASVALSAALIATSFTGLTALTSSSSPSVSAANSYGLADKIQDGNILHCFDWKLSDIKAELPNIAKAGFTSVQTSPLQPHDSSGAWYWLYQPLSFSVGNELGSEQDLKDLCSEADKYGIKVIVDVVANHFAGNHTNIQNDLKDSQYWHTFGGNVDWSNRWQVTHGEIGMPDLNSEHSYVQQVVANFTNQLKADGVDGIRWDAAKHIGLPSEDCNFWPAVTSGGLYNYGEILVGPADSGCETEMKEYTNYMSVTDSSYGDNTLGSVRGGGVPSGYGNWTARGLTSDKVVYWGESHDTYANGEGKGSNSASQNEVDRAYAIVASRYGSTGLYFSRPSQKAKDAIKIGDKGSTHYTSVEVAAVNQFKNAMIGKKDYYTSSNGCAVITRQGGGAVIVKGSGSGSVTVPNGGSYAVAGTYKDAVSGNTFTVTADSISGTIGDSGIAVIYNASQVSQVSQTSQTSQVSQSSQSGNYPTLSGAGFVYDNSSTNWGTVYAYVYDESGSSVTNNGQWPGVAMTKANGNYWTYNLDSKFSGSNIRVIFNNGAGEQNPGSQQPGFQMSSTDKKLYSGSWKDLPQIQQSSTVVSQVSQVSQESEVTDGPSVTFSKGNGTTFTGETLNVTLTLKNATKGTYSVDGGPVKSFTSTTTAVLGQGKIGDSTVTLDVTATDANGKTKSYSYKYNKDYVVETTTTGASALTGKYATNPNGQTGGAGVTINSPSDFKESMIIAQGVANDDPRIFRGSHEAPVYDTYALYAAWDDTNLYLGWQFTNVTDVVDPAQGYPISDNGKPWNGDIPQMLAFNLGKGKSADMSKGNMAGGAYVWGLKVGFETNIDALMCFSSKPGVGQPALFKTDSTGYFNYDVVTSFKEGGISFKYEDGFFGSSITGIKSNGYSGYKPDDLTGTTGWVDFLSEGHDKSQDTFYYMTIPLATLGVTRSYIESNGIGVMHISTFGEGGISSIPMDMTFLDNATTPYSQDESTSAEKEDTDLVSVPLASIGKAGTIIIEPEKTPLQVNFGANLSSPQYSNASLKLSAVGYGGTAPYQYQFYVDGTSVKAKNTTDTYTWSSPAVGEHTIKCVITDSTGATATVSKTFVVESNGTTVDPLTLTASLSATSVKVGGSITAKASGKGGTSPYKYAFFYKKSTDSSWTTAKAYSTTSSVAIKPAKAATYNVCIKVKDNTGTEVKKYINFTSTEDKALSMTGTLSATSVNVGGSVTAKATASGGTSPYKYAFFYKKSTDSQWVTAKDYSTTSSVTIKPAKAATYNVCIKVKDAKNTVVKKYIDFTFKAALSMTGTLSATSVTLGNSVTAKATASGGTSPYKYAFFYKKSTDSSWTTAKDYSTTASVAIKPAKAATYNVCIKVKDAKNTVVKKYIDFTSKQATALTNTSTLSATSINLGDKLTIKASAKGGTGSYQYAYFYKKSYDSEWTKKSGYTSTTSMTITPAKATTYNVVVWAKDSSGKVVKKYIDFTVKEALTAGIKAGKTSFSVGNYTVITGSATGGTGSITYQIQYRNINSTSWTTLKAYNSTATANFKPTAAGTYVVCVNAKDSAGTVSSAYLTITVK